MQRSATQLELKPVNTNKYNKNEMKTLLKLKQLDAKSTVQLK